MILKFGLEVNISGFTPENLGERYIEHFLRQQLTSEGVKAVPVIWFVGSATFFSMSILGQYLSNRFRSDVPFVWAIMFMGLAVIYFERRQLSRNIDRQQKQNKLKIVVKGNSSKTITRSDNFTRNRKLDQNID